MTFILAIHTCCSQQYYFHPMSSKNTGFVFMIISRVDLQGYGINACFYDNGTSRASFLAKKRLLEVLILQKYLTLV